MNGKNGANLEISVTSFLKVEMFKYRDFQPWEALPQHYFE